MADRLSVLKNIRSLRVSARETPLEELREYLEKLTIVVAEMEQAHLENEAIEREREEKLKEYIELMEQDGINPNDVAALYSEKAKNKPRRTSSAEPMYEFTDNRGNSGTWAGRGRMPNGLKELLSSGRHLEEFLINKE